MRKTLVTALAACADRPIRVGILRFLSGLSSDELQFIADFHGACILDSPRGEACSRYELEKQLEKFEQVRLVNCRLNAEDRQHKMILLVEYLCRRGVTRSAMPVGAGHA